MTDGNRTIDINDPTFDKAVADALRLSIQTTLSETFQVETEMEGWSVRKGPLEFDTYITCTVDMKQDNKTCSTFIMALDRETISKVLTKYGINGSEQNQEIILDAAGEVANMIYGMFKTALNKKGYHFVMDIPAVHTASEMVNNFSNSEKMVMPFLADGNQCRAIISHS